MKINWKLTLKVIAIISAILALFFPEAFFNFWSQDEAGNLTTTFLSITWLNLAVLLMAISAFIKDKK